MHLTDLKIKKLSLGDGEAKQKTYFDQSLKGFGLRVSVGGAKSFVVMYGSRRKLKTLGRYPELTLAEARVKAKKVLGGAAGVIEPEGGALLFLTARDRYLEDAQVRNKPSTYEAYKRVLLRYFNFTKKIGEITRHDVMEVVSDLKDRASESRHAFVAIRTMMNWAVMRGLIDHSPVPPIKYKVATRSRILSDGELKAVWHRASEVGYPYGKLVQLLILSGQRRGEIVGLRKTWIREGWIIFPVGFTKNKREHRIPCREMTKAIIEIASNKNDLLFPARGHTDMPFSGWSKAKREFDEGLNFSDYTLHDLRRTFSSNLAKIGVPIHVTEKLLNHVSGTVSGVAAVYNRHSYSDEMQDAMATHEKYLHKIVAKSI